MFIIIQHESVLKKCRSCNCFLCFCSIVFTSDNQTFCSLSSSDVISSGVSIMTLYRPLLQAANEVILLRTDNRLNLSKHEVYSWNRTHASLISEQNASALPTTPQALVSMASFVWWLKIYRVDFVTTTNSDIFFTLVAKSNWFLESACLSTIFNIVTKHYDVKSLIF